MNSKIVFKIAGLILFAVGVWGISEWIYPRRLPMVNRKLGQEKFEKYCSKCHSLEQDGKGYGPSLYRIAEVAGRRRPGSSAIEYLWESVVAPDTFKAYEGVMPKGIANQLGREGVFQVVCYLLDRDGRKNYSSLWNIAEKWEPSKDDGSLIAILPLGQLERGKAIFFGKGKCSECHKLNAVNAADHLFAPDISGVGINDKRYLLDSINCPSCVLAQGYLFANAKIDDLVVTGRLIENGNFITIVNRDINGFRIVQSEKTEADWNVSKTSLMPEYTDGALSVQEKEDLVLFLKALR